jgi:hypothetical protein
LKKEKQTIEKGSRRLTVRRKKKIDPTILKCYNCMFCTTLRNNKIKKPSGKKKPLFVATPFSGSFPEAVNKRSFNAKGLIITLFFFSFSEKTCH